MGLIKILRVSLLTVLLAGSEAAADDMRLESAEGDVTTNEYRAFIAKVNDMPPPPGNNIGNVMVYESVGGGKLHGLQTFYSFTKDRTVLDKAVVWSDAFLHARNDPTNGRVVWTGKRELCWPNKETNDDAHVLYSGAENGDVIEHIVNTAKLILENPAIWPETAPADTYGFGATYLERAKTYVNECQRSAETTIVPWYVQSTQDGYRLIHPDDRVYWKYCESTGPVPWNQQQCIVGGLLRLAQCHRLLNDGNTNTVYYEKITGDAADWFFASCMLVNAKGHVGYDWAYDRTLDIAAEPEDTGHSFYDVYVMRAYLANLGPTRTNMQRLINSAKFVLYLGTNRFAGQLNGTSNERRYQRKYLNYPWIEMSVLDREFYRMTAGAVLTSDQYFDDIPVEAAVLAAKHYWATARSAPPEIAEDASGLPPVPYVPQFSPRRLGRAGVPGICLLLWVGSELWLSLRKRSNDKSVSKDRGSLGLIWLVNSVAFWLGISAVFRHPEYHLPWPVIHQIGYCLFAAGLALRWYAIIYLGRFFTTNVAIASDHTVIDTGPYRLVRHPSYAGGLMTILGYGLILQNWVSIVIIVSCTFAVQLWRMHVEEKALAEGLGEPYRKYMLRTKRLVPWVY